MYQRRLRNAVLWCLHVTSRTTPSTPRSRRAWAAGRIVLAVPLVKATAEKLLMPGSEPPRSSQDPHRIEGLNLELRKFSCRRA